MADISIVADECVHGNIIKALRSAGYDVLSIDQELKSISDLEVAQVASSRNNLLISEDKDFGELLHRGKVPKIDIVLLRYKVGEDLQMIDTLLTFLKGYEQGPKQQFATLTPAKSRHRYI